MAAAASTSSSAQKSQQAAAAAAKRRRQKRRKLSQQSMQELLFIKQHANYNLPSVNSPKVRRQLSQYESHNVPPSELRAQIFRPQLNSPWAHAQPMVSCPCHGCGLALNAHSWLAHYLIAHQSELRMPFVNLPNPSAQHAIHASCPLYNLPSDVNILLGVFGYQRLGLNPLNCTRNTYLPDDYRQYSQHDVLLLFACRTQHAPLWKRKQLIDVLAIWVETPLQGVAIGLRVVAQDVLREHHYAKRIKARSLQTEQTQCRDFIKTDSNVLLINLAELETLLQKGQPLNVELHLTDLSTTRKKHM